VNASTLFLTEYVWGANEIVRSSVVPSLRRDLGNIVSVAFEFRLARIRRC